MCETLAVLAKASGTKFVATISGGYCEKVTPVPIPNTVVKLVYGDNTWLATAREDNSSRTPNTDSKESVFCFR